MIDKRTRDGRIESYRKEKMPNCEKGNHEWSYWFCVPAGLGRECKVCGKTEIREKEG